MRYLRPLRRRRPWPAHPARLTIVQGVAALAGLAMLAGGGPTTPAAAVPAVRHVALVAAAPTAPTTVVSDTTTTLLAGTTAPTSAPDSGPSSTTSMPSTPIQSGQDVSVNPDSPVHVCVMTTETGCPSLAEAIEVLGNVLSDCGLTGSARASCGALVEQLRDDIAAAVADIEALADCPPGSVCETAQALTLGLVGDVAACLGVYTGITWTTGMRANLRQACEDVATTLDSAQTTVLACLSGADATCATVFDTAAEQAETVQGCVVAALDEITTGSSEPSNGTDTTCAGVARSAADLLGNGIANVTACARAEAGTACQTLTSLADTATALASGCAADVAEAFGLTDVLIPPGTGESVCAMLVQNVARALTAAQEFVAECGGLGDVSCDGIGRAVREMAGIVAVCEVAAVDMAGINCGQAVSGALDVLDSILGTPCLGGAPNTHVAPTGPDDLSAIMANADLLKVVDQAPDEEEAAAVPAAVGVNVTVLECVDHEVGVNPVNLDGDLDGTSFWDGMPVRAEFMQQPGNDDAGQEKYVPPSIKNLKTPAINGDNGTEYGKPIENGQNANFGAMYWLYDSKVRDTRGRTMVAWQNPDLTAGDGNVKFTQAIAGIHEEAGNAYYAGSDPLGDRNIEDRQPIKVHVGFKSEVKDPQSGQTTGWDLSAERDFFVEHTQFGGGNLRTDSGRTYMHQGGFRKIVQGYRHQNRTWSEAAAFVFPPGSYQGFQLSVSIRYKN